MPGGTGTSHAQLDSVAATQIIIIVRVTPHPIRTVLLLRIQRILIAPGAAR